jgi:hypothetical protein
MRQSSHGSIARRRCIVCTSEYEIGTVAADEDQLVGWGLCPEHRELHGDGFIALIECDTSKSGHPIPGDWLNPERVHRTGLVAYLERRAVCSIFNIQLDPALPAVYVERGTIAKLHGLLPRRN